MRKKKIWLIVLMLILVVVTSCDFSLEIKKVELGKFPDNIVYYANEDSDLDFTGATIFEHTRGAGIVEIPFRQSVIETEYDIDFSRPGVYEVNITWKGEVIGRFPIQIIERLAY